MKSSDNKSLVEVWEMKEAAMKAFKDSGIKNYAEYIEIQAKANRCSFK